MEIRNKQGDVIGEVMCNHSMTLDEAMRLIGYAWQEDDNNSGYKVGNVYYDEGDLEMVG